MIEGLHSVNLRRTTDVPGYVSHASTLNRRRLRKLAARPRTVPWCGGCGVLLFNEREAAEHNVVREGHLPTCPRDLIAFDGYRMGDSFLTEFSGHLVRMWVHGLEPDGTPRIWRGSAQHSPDCDCCPECHAPRGKQHGKDCSRITRWEIEQ